MQKEFKNEAWASAVEKDFYLRTLKTIRFHRPLERFNLPTMTLLFVSRLTDPPIRQHFEDSSRHFKTYNLYTDISGFFTLPDEDKKTLTLTPVLFLDWLDILSRVKFFDFFLSKFLTVPQKAHLTYRNSLRSLGSDELAGRIADLYQTIGLTNFTKLNVIIAANDNKNIRFGVKHLCRALDNEEIKRLLSNKNIQVPKDYQTAYGMLDYKKNTLKYSFIGSIRESNKSLLNFLEKKTAWVMEKNGAKDLVYAKSHQDKRVLIIGRRILTRGQDNLNESSLIQSYDYQLDVNQKLLRMLLKSSLKSFRLAKVNVLIIIESFPVQVSHLIYQDEELRDLLHGNEIALACVEPETKGIYTFEGDQFISKSLHQAEV